MTQQEYQRYTERPITQVQFRGATSVRAYIETIAGSSYQGRELGGALHVLSYGKAMIRSGTDGGVHLSCSGGTIGRSATTSGARRFETTSHTTSRSMCM